MIALGSILLLFWFAWPYFYAISGTWEHVETSDFDSKESDFWREHMRLAHFGPIVMGGASVAGGKQNFLGLAFGRTIFLSRRDFGTDYFTRKGFPEGLSSELSGRVMARLRLKLSHDSMSFQGTFTPFRVEFDRKSLKLNRVIPVKKERRLYRRMGPLREPAESSVQSGVQAKNIG